jgi:TRAP-type C4-dicarboxylate transport system permease small subunit
MYNLIHKFVYYASATLFALASTLAFLCVIFRYVFNNSIVWGEEVIRLMFVWMFFFGAAEAFRIQKHITMDLLIEAIPQKAKRILKVIIDIFLMVFLLLVTYLGIRNCIMNMNQRTPALNIPYGILYGIIPLGAMLMFFFVIHNLIDRIKNKKPEGGNI